MSTVDHQKAKTPSVALVSMPFAVCAMPPIGLGRLQAALAERGIPATVYDFNLELLPVIADAVGCDLEAAARWHDEIAYLWDFMPGEWLFSPGSTSTDERYLSRLIHQAAQDTKVVELLRRLRPRMDGFVRRCAAEVVAGDHDIVGFTSSFMQTQPSVAVARILAAQPRRPHLLLGGSNAFGPMGTAALRAFPDLDVVVHGEAEELLPELVGVLRRDPAAVGSVKGISYRADGRVRCSPPAMTTPDISTLPTPSFDDYFARLHRLERTYGHSGLPRWLPIETARGCWWGAKSHCTFCGLNADRMTFRSLPPERALADIRSLRSRYGIDRFFAVDNIIDHRYFDTLLPWLATEEPGLHMHYEIKSNLTRERVRRLRAAGVRKVQPGIESLSTTVLTLMRKGVSGIQNVMALKWLTEYRLDTTWFILHGFPGEGLDPYEEMAELLPRLMHLVAPRELAPVYLERFSPYHTAPDRYGIRMTGPATWYHDAFPQVPETLLGDLAYRFEFEEPGRDRRVDSFVATTLRPLVDEWRERWERDGCTLAAVHGPDGESALVLGPWSHPNRVLLVDGHVGAVLRGADALTSRERLRHGHATPRSNKGSTARNTATGVLTTEAFAHFQRDHEAVLVDERGRAPATIDDTVDLLSERALLLVEDRRVLSLPVDRTRDAAGAPDTRGIQNAVSV